MVITKKMVISYLKEKKCTVCKITYGSDYHKDNNICPRCSPHYSASHNPKPEIGVETPWSQ